MVYIYIYIDIDIYIYIYIYICVYIYIYIDILVSLLGRIERGWPFKTLFVSVVIGYTFFVLISCSWYTQFILILILNEAVFSFEKGSESLLRFPQPY